MISFNRMTGVARGTFTVALGVDHTRLWTAPDLKITKHLIVKWPSGTGEKVKGHVGSEI